MKKIIFFCTLLYTLLIMAVPVKAGAVETEEVFGIVLDKEGNGLQLDPETWLPVHPYYNYISYKDYDLKPGEFIYTVATLDKYGEWESRKDYKTCFPRATKKKLKQYRNLANKGIYELDGIVTEVNRETDQIVFVTVDGNEWFDYGIQNIKENQRIHVILYDNGTPEVHDDQIMQIQWR